MAIAQFPRQDADRMTWGTPVRPMLTATSWSSGTSLSALDWLRYGQSLGRIGRGCGWWLGDWVRYGNARYGERYKLAAETTGYDAQTLMNMAYVASRFAISRRREGLSFSHHAELACLPEQDQEVWLDTASSEQLSVRALRHKVREELPNTAGDGKANRSLLLDASSSQEAGAGPLVCPSCGHHFRR